MTTGMKSNIPGSIRRDEASGGLVRKRRGPSAEQIAMMNAEQYKAYMQSRGEWPERQARDFSPESSGLFSFRDDDKNRWPF